jgi:enoyl-CoA hydratase/carnithine racemase
MSAATSGGLASGPATGLATVAVHDRIAVVTLNRPPVNALTVSGYREITAAFTQISGRPDISVAVLRSALATVFCAGADVKDLEHNLAAGNTTYDEDRQAAAMDLFQAIMHCPVPVIGCVNRTALGAGTVMLACCDFRVASDRAQIGLTEINVGRCGGGRHLSRILPQGWVRRMYFTGQPLSAADAYRLGAFEEIAPDGSEFDRAMEIAREIASKSPVAIRIGKEALDAAEEEPVEEGYRLEQACTLRLGATADAQEALAAFREKRAPVWGGR